MIKLITARKCDNCKMIRIPVESNVEKDGKRYLIFFCRICKLRDIEQIYEN